MLRRGGGGGALAPPPPPGAGAGPSSSTRWPTTSHEDGADADADAAAADVDDADADAANDGATGAPPPLRLHPLTLAFGDARLDAAYARDLAESQLAFERSAHAFHVAIALLHCGFSARAATGSLSSPRALLLIAPYVAAAALHWALSRARWYAARRGAVAVVMGAVYAAICVGTMPHWVLTPATGWKAYLKDFALGSGVLISVW